MVSFLTIDNLSKSYESGAKSVDVLSDVSFEVDKGQTLSITGPSGSGKSTLLHIIGTLDKPSTGNVRISGENPFELDEPSLAHFRNEKLGFVFQDHHLLPQYTVLENVVMPALAFKRDPNEERARELVERVGLGHRLGHRPAELSGGERQRVAIARALINQPDLLLCDEPTGNLDQNTASSVTDLLLELQAEEQSILVVVTHSPILANQLERKLVFTAGALEEVAAVN